MHNSLLLENGPCLEAIVFLAVGAAAVVGSAAIFARLTRSAVWQRTIWQAAALGILALVAIELTGSGRALVALARRSAERLPQAVSPAPRKSASKEATRGQSKPGGPPADNPGPAPIEAPPRSEPSDAARSVEARPKATTPPPVPIPVTESDLPEAATAQASAAAAATRPISSPPPADASEGSADPALSVVAWPSVGGRSSEAGLTAAERPWVWDPPTASPLPVHSLIDGVQIARSEPESVRITAAAQVAPRAVRPAAGAAARRPPPVASSRFSWWPSLLWAMGAAMVGARFARSRVLLAVFRRRQAPVREEALCRRVGALARRQGIRRPVVVLETPDLAAPVAFGTFRPTLGLPSGFRRDFEPRQQEAIIAHELAHLAACDPAWQLVADLVCTVLWWHPLCWWSRRRLRAASEAAADEASLLVPDGPDLLASSLLVLGQRLVGTPERLGWLSAGGSGFRSGLGRRVERLLHLSDRSRRPPGRASLAAAKTALPVALVIVALLSTAWAHPRASLAEGGTTMNVWKTSWRRSLAAAAVAAVLLPVSGDALSQEEGDRPAAERRERERPERQRRERGEREFLRHQVDVLRTAMHALREAERGDAVELVERAIRAREVMLEGRRDDEAHQIREHAPPPRGLAEILGMAVDLWREFDQPEKAEQVARLAEMLRASRDREPGRGRDRRERAERDEARREARDVVHALRREMEELDENSRRIQAELRELGDGRAEESRELRHALLETRARMKEIERELAEVMGDRRERGMAEREREMAERERDELARRVDELMEAHERAAREGRHEEAERLLREAKQIRRNLARHGDRPEGPPPEEREEMERRMHHVRVAVENLHAAGFHEQADQLAQQMKRLLHGRPEPGPPPRDPRREGPAHPEGLERVLHELHGAIGQLNERMEALSARMEGEIGEIRRQMETMGREIEERTRDSEERSDDMAREMDEMREELEEELEEEVEEMMGFDEEENDADEEEGEDEEDDDE